ncbi:MAG: hypothetical protein FWD61_10300, partial [Phycisphaerales bacterium]|nr:hypothetical protein [Phycisphaerales bacterium]
MALSAAEKDAVAQPARNVTEAMLGLEAPAADWRKVVPQELPKEEGRESMSQVELPKDAPGLMAMLKDEDKEQIKPALSESLTKALATWKGTAVDKYFIAKMKRCLDLSVTMAALERRETLQKSEADALREMIKAGGELAGVAAAVLEDAETARRILGGTDAAAQGALLASSRMTCGKLPVEVVGKLMLGENKELAAAAERYLENEDREAAWKLVLAKHPGEMLILGHVGENVGFDQKEADLRKRLKEPDGPSEVYGLLGWGSWTGPEHGVVEVCGEKYWLRHDLGNGKTRSRQLTAEEVGQLKALVAKKIDELPPLEHVVFDGIQYEYVHLTKAGGRRVFMNNPGVGASGGTIYQEIAGQFRQWMHTGDFVTRYDLLDQVKGAEVLWMAGEKDSKKEQRLDTVWAKGDDVRVRIGKEWRKLTNGKLQAAAEEPAELNVEKGETVRAERWGIIRYVPGQKPVTICEGDFDYSATTPDGKWVVTTQAFTNIDLRSLVRVEVATGKVTEVDVGGRGAGEVGCYLPWAGKVLVAWGKVYGSERTYRLVD